MKFGHTLIIALFFTLLLILQTGACITPAQAQETKPSIGLISIFDDASVLERLGVPQPVEEGTPHILVNSGGNVYLRLTVKPITDKKTIITSVRLGVKDEFYNSRRNRDMFMLTGFPLQDMETDKGIKPGSDTSEVKKEYGSPSKTIEIKESKTRQWIYEFEQKGKKITLSFIFKSNRVSSILLEY
jgi:hypothetical protein